MEKIFLVGNLTRDPETAIAKNGKKVCHFCVAVNSVSSERGKPAHFYQISAWGKTGENCERYLAKGRKVALVGSIEFGAYIGSDGNPRVNANVTASDIQFLSSPEATDRPLQSTTPASSPAASSPPSSAADGFSEVGDDDDLPF